MSDLERELRETLHDRAGATSARVEPPADLADRVRARRVRQRALASGGALALALIVVIAGLTLTRNVDDVDSSILVGAAGAPSEIVAVTTDGNLVVLDTETGGLLRTLVDGSTGPVAPDTPAVTPDGRFAYVTIGDGCEAAILKVDLVSGVGPGADPAVIVHGASPSLSPDATELAFLACDAVFPSSSADEPSMLPSELGTAVAIHDLDDFSTTGWELRADHDDWLAGEPVAWTDDGRVLVRVGQGPDGASPLRLLDPSRPGPVDLSPVVWFPDSGSVFGVVPETGELLGVDDADPEGRGSLSALGEPVRIVTIDPGSGLAARDLFRVRGTVTDASTDPTGRHVLVVDANGALWSWSEGDDVVRHVADGVVSAAWIPGRTVEPAPTTTSSTTTSTIPAPRCSASAMKIAAGPDPTLPEPVQETWSAILEAAVACDWDALRALMVDDFAHSVAALYSADAAIAAWQDAEARGEPILRTLVERLLDPPRVERSDPTVYEWPDPTSDLLYRAGIREDGAWVSFLAGD